MWIILAHLNLLPVLHTLAFFTPLINSIDKKNVRIYNLKINTKVIFSNRFYCQLKVVEWSLFFSLYISGQIWTSGLSSARKLPYGSQWTGLRAGGRQEEKILARCIEKKAAARGNLKQTRHSLRFADFVLVNDCFQVKFYVQINCARHNNKVNATVIPSNCAKTANRNRSICRCFVQLEIVGDSDSKSHWHLNANRICQFPSICPKDGN